MEAHEFVKKKVEGLEINIIHKAQNIVYIFCVVIWRMTDFTSALLRLLLYFERIEIEIYKLNFALDIGI